MGRNLLDLSNYEEMAADECWRRYKWGAKGGDGETFHAVADGFEVFCSKKRKSRESQEEDAYRCEIFNGKVSLGQGIAPDYENAIMSAFVEMVGRRVMFEAEMYGNSEMDSNVQSTSFEAYIKLFEGCEAEEIDDAYRDMLLAHARRYVMEYDEKQALSRHRAGGILKRFFARFH